MNQWSLGGRAEFILLCSLCFNGASPPPQPQPSGHLTKHNKRKRLHTCLCVVAEWALGGDCWEEGAGNPLRLFLRRDMHPPPQEVGPHQIFLLGFPSIFISPDLRKAHCLCTFTSNLIWFRVLSMGAPPGDVLGGRW